MGAYEIWDTHDSSSPLIHPWINSNITPAASGVLVSEYCFTKDLFFTPPISPCSKLSICHISQNLT
jgi:hypothetical protein